MDGFIPLKIGDHRLVVWNINSIFPEILGISSSQLTQSYFSEGWPKPPTSDNRFWRIPRFATPPYSPVFKNLGFWYLCRWKFPFLCVAERRLERSWSMRLFEHTSILCRFYAWIHAYCFSNISWYPKRLHTIIHIDNIFSWDFMSISHISSYFLDDTSILCSSRFFCKTMSRWLAAGECWSSTGSDESKEQSQQISGGKTWEYVHHPWTQLWLLRLKVPGARVFATPRSTAAKSCTSCRRLCRRKTSRLWGERQSSTVLPDFSWFLGFFQGGIPKCLVYRGKSYEDSEDH